MRGVYEILSLVTGRRYIGSSANVARRWREHRSGLARGVHPNAALQADWTLHGAAAFGWRVVETIDGPQRDRILSEQRHLDATVNPYNASRRAGSGPRDGFRHTPESIAKMRLVAQGKRNKSPETRAKISASRRGRTLSPEHRQHIGLALKGRARPGHSALLKGRPWSPARRAAFERGKAA